MSFPKPELARRRAERAPDGHFACAAALFLALTLVWVGAATLGLG